MSETTMLTRTLAVFAFLTFLLVPIMQVLADTGHGDEPVETPSDGVVSRTSVVSEFNVSVTFKYEANKPEILNFQEGMKLASRMLYDTSEGAFRLRNVDIWTNMKNVGTSEIVIENEGGYYRAWTNLGGIDLPYSQVHLGKSAYGAQWNQPQGTTTIVHEWGHYALYLPDEYEDTGGISVPWCNNCIMSDGNFTELCGAWNHNYTNPSPNQTGKSCWANLIEHYPGAAANEPMNGGAVNQNGPVYAIPAEDPNVVLHVADMCITAQDLTLIGTPTTGDTTTLHAFVHNLDGLLASNDLEIEVFDGPRGDNKFITGSSKVVMQENITFDLPYVVRSGTHDLYVYLDPDNNFNEWDEEQNNLAIIKVTGNDRPALLPGLATKNWTASEDNYLDVNLMGYAQDTEDKESDLRWWVLAYDHSKIANVSGENATNETLIFKPVKDFAGNVVVNVNVTDKMGANVSADLNLQWTQENDLPVIIQTSTATPQVDALRGDPVVFSIKGYDVEDLPEGATTYDGKVTVEAYLDQNKLEDQYDIPLPGTTIMDEGGWLVFTGTVPLHMKVGTYNVMLRLKDSGGGSSAWAILNDSVIGKNNLPVLEELEKDSNEVYRGSLLPLTFKGSDSEDTTKNLTVFVEVSANKAGKWVNASNGSAYQDIKGSFTLDFVPPTNASLGLVDVRVALRDKDNGMSPWSYLNGTITVKNVLPIVTKLTPEKNSVLRTSTIALTIEGNDLEDIPAKMRLQVEHKVSNSWDNESIVGEPVLKSNGMAWTVNFTPVKDMAADEVSLRARLIDSDGGEGEWLTGIKVNVQNNLPTAEFIAPNAAKAGESVNFDASTSTDPEDGTALNSYSWTFSDGGTSNGKTIKHKFKFEKTYTVKLTVKDSDGGSSTSEKKISISPGETGLTSGANRTLLFGAVGGVIGVVVIVVLVMLLRRKRGATVVEALVVEEKKA